MGEQPVPFYKVIDRRGQNRTYDAPSSGGSNNLIRAAQQNDQRRFIPDLNQDFHRNVSANGRRTISTLGQYLYANNSIVRGAINEMAWYSCSTWIPQYYGRNNTWGDLAESWMFEHDKIFLLNGGTKHDYLMALIKGVLVPGDIATIYTETANGYPKFQLIGGHRIRSATSETIVKGGEFDGATIIDGVIVDDYLAPLGYRVWTGDTYRDIPSTGMKLHFIRHFDGQLRGLSELACAAFDFQDIREIKDLDLAALKLLAGIGVIETNEAGEADTTRKHLRQDGTPQDGKPQAWKETQDGVSVRYLKAGTGSSLTEMKSDRPGVNSQNFKKDTAREGLHSLGWNYDFTLDPTKVGGAQARICVTKINKTIQFVQTSVIKPASVRADGYRTRKAIKLEELPEDIDWWKFEYQGPAELTSDEKYSSDTAIQEIRAGLKTPQEACAEREVWWEEVQDQLIAYEKRLQRRCKEESVDPNRIILQTPNGNPAAGAPVKPKEEDQTKTQPTEE
jgi:hypothetical protein